MNVRHPFLAFALVAALIPVFSTGCSKQARKERHLKRAEAYFLAKDFRKAEIEYRNVLGLDRTNAFVVKRLATIYGDQGRFEQALPFLLAARQLDKDDTGVRIKLAQIFLPAGQIQQAREQAVYVLDRDPKNDDALLLLADAISSAADLADTQQRLQKVEAQAVSRAAWHLATARVFLRQTNHPAAAGALQKALSLEPQSSHVHLNWAAYYWMQQDLKKADQSFQKAAELAPLDASVWLRRVDFKVNTGSGQEGQDLLRQITAKMPDFVPAWVYLARFELDAQRFLQCSNILVRLETQDPGNYQGRLLKGRLARAQGNAADGVKIFEALSLAYKGSDEVQFELALAHVRNQDPAMAALSLQEALKLNPDNSQAALLQAELLVQKGDSTAAVRALQSLVQRHPEITRAQLLLGGAYTALGRNDDALALYRAMEQRFPKVPDVPFLIGMALRQQPNRNAEARRAFERAAALSTNDLFVTYQLVELDIVERNYPAAFQRVRNLLAVNPKSGGAKYLEARIFFAQTNLAQAEAALKQALEWEPNSGTAYDLLTQTYLAGNKLPEALENLDQMRRKNPKDSRVVMEIAVIFERQGETAKAAAAYEDLLKIDPDFVPALNNLAYILSDKLGKHDAAYPLASKARELAPQSAPVADTLGWIHFRRREYPRALALLQESVAKLPDDPQVQFHVGMACYMMGQEQLARLAFQRALERSQEFPGRAEVQKRLALLDLDPAKADPAAIASLEAQVRLQPDDLPALIRLGRVHERTGAPDKARQAYDNARKVNPNSAPVLLQLARLHATNLKDPQQALMLAREARKLAPDDPHIAHVLGRLAAQSGDNAWASSLLLESAQTLAGNPEVLFDLAHVQFAVGRVNDADATMRRAVQVAAASPPASDGRTRGDGLGLSGEFAPDAQWFLALIGFMKSSEKRLEAEPQVQQLLKSRPDYLPALMVSGLIHEQRGLFQEARQVYERILTGNPQFAPARKQLAGLLTDQFGDQQKALEQASKAREVLTEDPELARTLGKIAFRRGDFANAIRFLQESSLKLPNDAEVFYFLGLAHYQRKSREESKLALERALSLSPKGPFVPEVKKVLAELK